MRQVHTHTQRRLSCFHNCCDNFLQWCATHLSYNTCYTMKTYLSYNKTSPNLLLFIYYLFYSLNPANGMSPFLLQPTASWGPGADMYLHLHLGHWYLPSPWLITLWLLHGLVTLPEAAVSAACCYECQPLHGSEDRGTNNDSLVRLAYFYTQTFNRELQWLSNKGCCSAM